MRINNYCKALLLVPVFIAIIHLAQASYIHVKAELAQHLLQSAWQRQIRQSAQAKLATPWWWADFYPVARLQIPKLALDTIVLNTDSGQALAFGPGLIASRGSQAKFIAGHNDTHFAGLAELSIGDILYYQSSELARKEYRVTHKLLLDTRQQQLNYSAEQNNLFLLTCWQENTVDASLTHTNTPYRLIIEAEAIN